MFLGNYIFTVFALLLYSPITCPMSKIWESSAHLFIARVRKLFQRFPNFAKSI